MSESMTKRGIARLRPVVALLLLAAVAAGCSSSDEAISGESNFPAPSTNPTNPPPPVTTLARAACAANTLGPAAAPTFEGAVLVDVVCEQTSATATLTNGPGGEQVVLFALQNGAWVLVGSGPVDADLVSLAPAGFSPTALPTWQRTRTARLTKPADGGSKSPTTETPPSSTRTNPDTKELEVCTEYSADFVECVTATTTPPPTEAPDPENPDAPPAPPVTSNFCRYNYNDTRCTESNQQFQPRN